MPVAGTSVDYSNRILDMYISGNLNPLSSNVQTVSYSFGTVTKFIAGTQKLIQRFIISIVNSGLVEDLVGSNNSNIQVAKNLFNSHKADVVSAFRTYQNSLPSTTIIPLDEQLDTAQLLSVTSLGDAIKFSVNIITKAGSTVTVLLPLPLL